MFKSDPIEEFNEYLYLEVLLITKLAYQKQIQKKSVVAKLA